MFVVFSLSLSLLLSLLFASNISIWIYIKFDDCNISRENHIFINFLYTIYIDLMKKYVYEVYGGEEDTCDRVRYFCRRRYLLIQIENM